ncbi:MAG: ABC transporter ATP-binding protein [Bacillota bacterium]|nr:ABC transporter ATP-binding protein [Bacillota bacterium]
MVEKKFEKYNSASGQQDFSKVVRQGFGRGGGRGGLNSPRLTVEKPKNAWKTIYRIMTYLSKRKLPLFTALFLVVVASATSLGGSYLIRPIINDYIIPGDLKGLANMCLVMAGVYVIGSISTLISNRMLIRISQRTTNEMRKDLFSRIELMSVKFFDNNSVGDIMSRFTNDLEGVNSALNQSISALLSGILNTVGTIILMLVISPPLALISFVSIPLISFVTSIIAKKTRKIFGSYLSALGQVNGFTEETISGQYAIQMFTQEDRMIGSFENYIEELRKSNSKAQIYAGLIMPFVRTINTFFYALTIFAGGLLAISGKIDIGGIGSFMKYARQFGHPINEIANQFNSLQSAIAGAERVFATMDLPNEYEDEEAAIPINNINGDIMFKNVNFSYIDGKPILKGIDINVKAGQRIAIVGPTGAGKTTIANILMRFYDTESGMITVDEIPLEKIKKHSLRENFGIVLQDTHLFSMSIKENIRYGKPEATDDEVIKAAQLANADRFIRQLPNGYDTPLQSSGTTLSQGQQQLINIARAFLIDPPMLILDEATSNVDTRTEVQIQSAMKTLMQGKTCFIIAHRLSTIKDCDMILVLNDGEIVERGTQNELVELNGLYAQLYKGIYEDFDAI